MSQVVREVWLFASAVANVHVEITAGFARKIAARLAHEGQTPDPEALPAGWRARAAEVGSIAQVELGEAVTMLSLD